MKGKLFVYPFPGLFESVARGDRCLLGAIISYLSNTNEFRPVVIANLERIHLHVCVLGARFGQFLNHFFHHTIRNFAEITPAE